MAQSKAKRATDVLDRDEFWDGLTAGKTDEEIARAIGVEPDAVKFAREGMISTIAGRVTLPVGDQFAEYRVRMEGVLRQMDRVRSRAMSGQRPKLKLALDASVAMARVIDRTVERGQELGVLPKAITQRQTKVAVSGSVMVGAMTNDELVRNTAELAKRGREMRQRFGGGAAFAALPMPDVFGDAQGDVIDAEPARVELDPPAVTRRKV